MTYNPGIRCRLLSTFCSLTERGEACQFYDVWRLEVGGDSVGVGGGKLGEGLFSVRGRASLDKACGACSFVAGLLASVGRWAARLSSMFHPAIGVRPVRPKCVFSPKRNSDGVHRSGILYPFSVV